MLTPAGANGPNADDLQFARDARAKHVHNNYERTIKDTRAQFDAGRKIPRKWTGATVFKLAISDARPAVGPMGLPPGRVVADTPRAATANDNANKHPAPADRKRSVRLRWPCPVCRSNLQRRGFRRVRRPEDCKRPITEPRKYDSLAHDPGRTMEPGKCRLTNTPERTQGKPREGHHPRDAHATTSIEPTHAQKIDPAAVVGDDAPVVIEDKEQQGGATSSSTKKAEQQTCDQNIQSDSRGIEWDRCDLGRSLWFLRSQNPVVVR